MSTFVQYDGADGDLGKFDVPFPYLLPQHVKVKVNGFPQTQGAHYQFEGASQIRFMPWAVPLPTTVVEVRRDTASDSPLVAYQNSAVLTAADLNTATRQNFYLVQEVIDWINALLGAGASRLSNGQFTNAQELIDAAVASVLESELLANLQARISDIDANAQSILEQTNRVAEMRTVIDQYIDDFADIDAQIISEQESRVDGDTALAQTLSLLGAKNGANTAFILDTSKVFVNGTTSIGTRLSGIDTRAGNIESSITTEATARSSADSALSTLVTNLTSTVTGNYSTLNAAIGSEATTRANADSAEAVLRVALAARVTSAETGLTNASAAITNEATVRASGDTANASLITGLTTTVNGHTSSIQTHQTTLNGVTAQYMVKTDVNGRVAGFGLYNNGATSDFIVLANRFAVVDPANNANVKVPFIVTGGVVYMQNVVIASALIESLTVGKLTSGSLTATITQNADINVGTGRIIWSNGVIMKVMGVGFGTSGQFISWFGPVMSLSACSEATAISYEKTNGNTYFGGTLHAGTLSTSGSTSDLGATATVTIGPLGSNGNDITVTYSVDMLAFTGNNSASNPWGGSGTLSIALQRKIGVGTLTTVATQNLSGTSTTEDAGGGSSPRYFHRLVIGGSYTYTDNAHSTSDRTYTLSMTARDKAGGGFLPSVTVQKLSIISVEQ